MAKLRWAPASGAVTGYQYFVARNGGPLLEAGLTPTNELTISGNPGDYVEVVVRAWGYPYGVAAGFDYGPESVPSDPIRFDGAPVVKSAYPILDCTSCGRFETRDLGNQTLIVAPHPTPGSWELVGVGELIRGSLQAVLRERTTGGLWVGELWGGGLLPIASRVGANYSRMTVAPPRDVDGDGLAEILVHDPSTGRIEVWGIANGALVQRAVWSASPGLRLVGAGDLDGDRISDLWFDAEHGFVRVDRYRNLAYAGSTFFATPAIDFSAVDVADYDGDGISDLLWREEGGGLLITRMRGDWAAPQAVSLPLASLPGDKNVDPRGSFDLDGVRGAEILLQDRLSGAVDVALPSDSTPGRRQRLLTADPGWRVAGID